MKIPYAGHEKERFINSKIRALNRSGNAGSKATCQNIIEETCEKYRLTHDGLVGVPRTTRLTKIKRELYFRLHLEAGMGHLAISKKFGITQSNVQYAIKTYTEKVIRK